MCRCNDFGDYAEIGCDDAHLWEAGFTTVASRDTVELKRCDACGVHWQVDLERENLAIRVNDPAGWKDFDDRPVRLEYMIHCHGGLDPGKCIWAGCSRQPLKGMMLCPHHQYPYYSNEVGENDKSR